MIHKRGSSYVALTSKEGNDLIINNEGQAHTVMRGKIDEGNSTIVNLLADGVFTGTAIDTLDYGTVTLSVHSDVESADNGLMVQYSSDGTDWHDGETYTIKAGADKFFTPTMQSRYMRVQYTNGSSDTTVFHIHTVLRKTPIKWSSHNIDDPIKDEDDAELVKAVITGKKANGEFDNVSLTNGGNAKVSLEELESGVSSNSNSQLNTTAFHADGTEGNLITGVKKETGKDGVDSSTNSLQFVDYAHHEVHGGSAYFYKDYYSLPKNGNKEFILVTPNTAKYCHFVFNIETITAAVDILIYEGATTSSDGALETVRNRNRNIADSPTTMLYEDPTVTADGSEIKASFVGAGRNSEGGTSRDDQEIVLKSNTKYLIRMTEQNTDATVINVRFDWYEHTDKN